MTTEFKTVYITCETDHTPDYYRLDPEHYRPLALKAMNAFKAIHNASSILIDIPPHFKLNRFGSTEMEDEEGRELLGQVIDPTDPENPQQVFEFDLEEDCNTIWSVRDLEIRRPFANFETGIPVCCMRLTWTSEHTSDEMHVDFQIDVPEAFEVMGRTL